MLRRTVSFPIEARQLQQLGLLGCRSHSVTSCSVLDLPALLNAHHGQRQWEDERWGWYQGHAEEGQWEDERELEITPSSTGGTRGPRWSDMYTSSDQLRSVEDDGNDYEEKKQNDEFVRLYVSEEERILNSADLSAEERSDVLAELVYSRSRLKQLNSELQRTVELADDNNTLLRTENASLRNQVKGMKRSIHDAEQLMDELEEIRSLSAEKDGTTGNLESYIKQLEKEKESLEDQIETFGSEMSRIIPDRATDKKKIADLSNALQALQLRLEESRLTLDQRYEVIHKKDFVIKQLEQSLTEYSSIAQDLKEKMKDLESQVAEALVNGGEGRYMALDGTLSAATQRSISLAEEMGLLPRMMDESSDEEVQEQRDERVEKEEKQRVEERKEREENEKKEEEVKEEKQLLQEKRGVWSDLVGGVQAAGGFTLGFLAPLGVLVSMVPGCYDHCTGLSCTDILWSTVRYLIQPYCNVHHIGLPPL
ncbi:golgin subfamily A member 6-like protein 24 [Salvelinus fontinalis]|uniref:golgin subfamily A member 6-like protein 24 n=1 Tax=Salvelinus fontinalis TaxID=8038 RepID=UPI0024859AC7|nr:golgin subfamily A member 6-like protein 24 [Salvelinus fontinalis]XP_055737978.1 golgin subfamily A member 6-like protein 24 [Salvelinus fontinalis]XP_055737979.1 golgin subfamily A member 6-like protein 24 [Salvelinus fontinalis]XP_055737980.1 golgin subfamily A member 6-like protein 24 [Salvelinus fontinalis]